MPRKTGTLVVIILLVAAFTAVGIWRTRGGPTRAPLALTVEPSGVMGTSCRISVTVTSPTDRAVRVGLDRAEGLLRGIESRMSVWLDDSEVSRLNRAPAGRKVSLSAETGRLLQTAWTATEASRGAFDVTVGPLIELWKRSAEAGRLPTEQEVAAARALSHWDLIELREDGVVKTAEGARVDLGGIAKGYAIDQAADYLVERLPLGGLVDIGGDIRVWGRPPQADRWEVAVRDPFGPGELTRLRPPDGAVCTSGEYARFLEIEGRHYNHIIDPRTGRPAEGVVAVTVFAARAEIADIWATALIVLGPDGVGWLPEGIEVLFVLGTPEEPRLLATPGFVALLVTVPEGLAVVGYS